jgi:hypothetical protein
MSTLKKFATHAHFLSIFICVVLLFTNRSLLWPHPIMIMATTLLAATFIPPFGLMDPSKIKKDDPKKQEIAAATVQQPKQPSNASKGTKGTNNKKKNK